MKTAIVFLTYKPHQNTVLLADTIRIFTDFDCYIIADNNEEKYTNNVLQLEDDKCAPYINSATYKGITSLQKNPNSWDKMFYFFLKEKDYDFVWVFEDDVFIPSVDTIVNLHSKYKDYDLVVPNNFKKTNNIKDTVNSSLLFESFNIFN